MNKLKRFYIEFLNENSASNAIIVAETMHEAIDRCATLHNIDKNDIIVCKLISRYNKDIN